MTCRGSAIRLGVEKDHKQFILIISKRHHCHANWTDYNLYEILVIADKKHDLEQYDLGHFLWIHVQQDHYALELINIEFVGASKMLMSINCKLSRPNKTHFWWSRGGSTRRGAI